MLWIRSLSGGLLACVRSSLQSCRLDYICEIVDRYWSFAVWSQPPSMVILRTLVTASSVPSFVYPTWLSGRRCSHLGHSCRRARHQRCRDSACWCEPPPRSPDRSRQRCWSRQRKSDVLLFTTLSSLELLCSLAPVVGICSPPLPSSPGGVYSFSSLWRFAPLPAVRVCSFSPLLGHALFSFGHKSCPSVVATQASIFSDEFPYHLILRRFWADQSNVSSICTNFPGHHQVGSWS